MIKRPIKLLIEMEADSELDPFKVAAKIEKSVGFPPGRFFDVKVTLLAAGDLDDPFGPPPPRRSLLRWAADWYFGVRELRALRRGQE